MIEKDIDVLNIDLVQMKKDIVKECRFDDIWFDCSINAMKELLDEAIEIDVGEDTYTNHRERGIIRKKNGGGIYGSGKNVHISIEIILEGLLLIENMTYISAAIFLYKLFQQLCVDIDRWQMSVYMILYQANKSVHITDDNILCIVQKKINDYGYEDVNEEEIMNTVNKLYNLGIISIEDGVYKAEEKVYL